MHSRWIGFFVGMLPLIAEAQPPAVTDPQSLQRLEAGDVEVHASVSDKRPGGQVTATVMIHARPQTVWNVMRECEQAASYIPGLRRCHRIEAAPDGSWEIIEHEVKYSWLMPAIHSVLRIDYHPWQMDFHSLSGDLKTERGKWLIRRSLFDDTATIVEYQLYVDPGFWVPRALIRASLRSELPRALEALRARAESIDAATLASTSPLPASNR